MRVAQQSLDTSAHVASAHKLRCAQWECKGDKREVVLACRQRIKVVLCLLRGGGWGLVSVLHLRPSSCFFHAVDVMLLAPCLACLSSA